MLNECARQKVISNIGVHSQGGRWEREEDEDVCEELGSGYRNHLTPILLFSILFLMRDETWLHG